MEKINQHEYIWAEKYRPQTINDLIITESLRSQVKTWIEEGQIPNLGLFSSTPGTGKTSFAKAIANELNADCLSVNASKESGIDLVRNKLQNFASTVSLEGMIKIAFLDEVDGTTGEMQKSIRGFIEEFTQNCRFIMTGNYINKIIGPVLNRLSIIDFDVMFNKNYAEIGKQILNRLEFILKNENVEYDVETLKPLITGLFPSVREMTIILQQSVVNKKLELDMSYVEMHKSFINLLNAIKDKDYIKCRSIVSDIPNPTNFYSFLYKNLNKYFEEKSMASLVIALHHFMSSNVNARDPEISLAAFCASLVRSQEIFFKKL
jgi:replication factor C small subunit